MKALLAFSSGGSGFPGSPVAGVYFGFTSGEFLAICAEILAVEYSIVLDIAAGGLIWISEGSQMILLGGSVDDSSFFPFPGTQGGIVFSISSQVAIYNNDTGVFYYFDGSDWQILSGN